MERIDGPGAPPDELPHIFERFYRAGSQGTRGSGLRIRLSLPAVTTS
jgi:signal transduction histidine kinase